VRNFKNIFEVFSWGYLFSSKPFLQGKTKPTVHKTEGEKKKVTTHQFSTTPHNRVKLKFWKREKRGERRRRSFKKENPQEKIEKTHTKSVNRTPKAKLWQICDPKKQKLQKGTENSWGGKKQKRMGKVRMKERSVSRIYFGK